MHYNFFITCWITDFAIYFQVSQLLWYISQITDEILKTICSTSTSSSHLCSSLTQCVSFEQVTNASLHSVQLIMYTVVCCFLLSIACVMLLLCQHFRIKISKHYLCICNCRLKHSCPALNSVNASKCLFRYRFFVSCALQR